VQGGKRGKRANRAAERSIPWSGPGQDQISLTPGFSQVIESQTEEQPFQRLRVAANYRMSEAAKAADCGIAAQAPG